MDFGRRCVGLAICTWLALALVGCGSDGHVDARAGAPRPSSTTAPPDASVSSPPLSPGSSVPSPGGERVTPMRGALDVHSLSFAVDEVHAVDGGVVVPFWGGVAPCFVLARYQVDETAQSVTIALYAGRAPTKVDVACIELAKRYEVKVPLAAPLGTRTVVDANA
jgi:hypothetical protein